MAQKPITFTEQEVNFLTVAIDGAIASAKRSQNTQKQQSFKELYKQSENILQGLKIKINQQA